VTFGADGAAAETIHELYTRERLGIAIRRREVKDRQKRMERLRREFTAVTRPTADSLAREYHRAMRSWSSGGARALSGAIASIRGDGSLRVVEAGFAGGLKVVDTRHGAFFKLSEDPMTGPGRRLYRSPVMRDKPAKHELAALAYLHGLDLPHVTVPLVSCVDVMIRDGRGGTRDGGHNDGDSEGDDSGEDSPAAPPSASDRAYRVQVFALLTPGLRMGSGDGCRTIHVCAEVLATAQRVADAFHLAPSARQPSSGTVHVVSYEQPPCARDTRCVPDFGPATDRILEGLGCARQAAVATGCIARTAEEMGAVLDPLQPMHPTMTTEVVDLGQPDRSRVLAALPPSVVLPGPSDGPVRIGLPLPFDVEMHILPSGERCVLDTHRLLIPERFPPDARWRSGNVLISVPVGGDQAEAPEPRGTWRLAAVDDAIRLGTGVEVLLSSDGRHVALAPDPALYWQAAHLTALFPPSAGSVLDEGLGRPRVSPDAVFAGDPEGSLIAATAALTGAENAGRAAEAVVAGLKRLNHPEVIAATDGGGPPSAKALRKLRRAVKAGLHARGLGLRHVGWVWDAVCALADGAGGSATGPCPGDAPSPLLPRLARIALAAACLPGTGSSAGLALERLCALGGNRSDWVAACIAARAAACKGRGLDGNRVRCMVDDVRAMAAGPLAAWLGSQQRSARAATWKRSGTIGASMRSARATIRHGSSAIAAVRAELLAEIAHRQRVLPADSEELATRLTSFARFSRVAPEELHDEAIAALFRAAARPGAGPEFGAESFEQLTVFYTTRGEHAACLELNWALHESLLTKPGGGPDAPDVVFTLRDIGESMLEAGTGPEAALAIFRESEAQAERVDPALLVLPRTSIGKCQHMLGKLEEARATLQSVVTAERAAGREVADSVLELLAYVLDGLSDPDEEIKVLSAVTDSRRRNDGRMHPDYGSSASELGTSLLLQGRPREAERHLRRAYRALLASVGATDERTLQAQAGLAEALGELGRTKVAVAMYKDYAAQSRLAGTEPSAAHAGALVSLAGYMLDLEEDEDEAAAVLVRALEVGLGASDAPAAGVARSGAMVLNDHDLPGRAMALLLDAARLIDETAGPGSMDAARCLSDAGYFYLMLDKEEFEEDEAAGGGYGVDMAEVLRGACVTLQAGCTRPDEDAATAMHRLGACLLRRDEPAEAATWLEQAMTWQEEAGGADCEPAVISRQLLAHTFCARDDDERGLELLDSCIESVRRRGEDASDTVTLEMDAIGCLTRMGLHSKALQRAEALLEAVQGASARVRRKVQREVDRHRRRVQRAAQRPTRLAGSGDDQSQSGSEESSSEEEESASDSGSEEDESGNEEDESGSEEEEKSENEDDESGSSEDESGSSEDESGSSEDESGSSEEDESGSSEEDESGSSEEDESGSSEEDQSGSSEDESGSSEEDESGSKVEDERSRDKEGSASADE